MGKILLLMFCGIVGSSHAYSGIWNKEEMWITYNSTPLSEFLEFYKQLLEDCNHLQQITRDACSSMQPSCCAYFQCADFCVSNCKEFLPAQKGEVLLFFKLISYKKCSALVEAAKTCTEGSVSIECKILKNLLQACFTKFPVSSTTSPMTSPVTSPTTSPATSPTPRPATSPASSPATSPTPRPATSPASSPATSPTTSPATSLTTSPVTSLTTSPLTSPVTSPSTSPSTSPTTSPATSPTTSPLTSPVTSPITSPTTSRPIGVFYCDVMGVTGRVQMPVSKWCDGVDDCTPNGEDEKAQNCNGCNAGEFKCRNSDTVCQTALNICNGVQDCPNMFDEVTSRCTPNS